LIWGKWETGIFVGKSEIRLDAPVDRPPVGQISRPARQVAVAAGIQVALIPLGDRDDETNLRADADGAFLESPGSLTRR